MGSGVALGLVEDLVKSQVEGPTALILESPFNNLLEVVRSHPFSAPWRFLPIFDLLYMVPLRAMGIKMCNDVRIAM
jgi:hypothetical protein